MGFYQPYKVVEPHSVTFILQTGDEITTPKDLAALLKADAVLVNLQTLDRQSQDLLAFGGRYSGETPMTKVVQFFGGAADAAPKAFDQFLEILKYTALGAAVLGAVWLGLKAYPFAQEAYEGATRKRVQRGA